MTRLVAFLCGSVAFVSAGSAAPPTQPPLPPAKPVTETIFGQSITDQFRYFEQQDATVTDWMKAEGRYARSVLDALPQHGAILAKLSGMTGSWDVVQSITRDGARIFYEQRSAGSDNFDLMVRDPDGKVRKLVDVAAIRAANGGEPFAINYFSPSNDGTKVAVGISEGGSEDASLWVYDAATGARIAGPVPNAQFGVVNWAPDDRSLFVNLLTPTKAGQDATDKYKFSKDYVWALKGDPVPVLGAGVSKAVPFRPEEFPAVVTVPGSPLAFAININGVQNEMAIWSGAAASAGSADAPWRALVSRDDDVTNISVAGTRIFLLSHKDAPTFKVLALDAGQPISAAKEVVAARPDRLIQSIAAAADGVYVGRAPRRLFRIDQSPARGWARAGDRASVQGLDQRALGRPPLSWRQADPRQLGSASQDDGVRSRQRFLGPWNGQGAGRLRPEPLHRHGPQGEGARRCRSAAQLRHCKGCKAASSRNAHGLWLIRHFGVSGIRHAAHGHASQRHRLCRLSRARRR